MGEVKKISKIFIAVMVIGFLCILLQDIDKTACASGTATTSSSSDSMGRIIYYGTGGLTTINADGTDMKRLGIDGTHPSWSPDGNKFAYVKDSDIYVATSDGKTNNKLVDNGNYPDWSPHGDKIAFLRRDSNYNNDIWTIKPDGTGETRVTTYDSDCPLGVEICWRGVSNLDLSADGAQFVANASMGRAIDDVFSGIFIFDADGTTMVYPLNFPKGVLIYGDHDNVYYPKWSPDGQKIALLRREYRSDSDDTHGIWIVNSDGGSMQRIGSTVGLVDSSFAWSPDGTEIAAITTKGIQAFKADGSGNRLITGDEGEADWSYGLDWEPVFDDPGDVKGTIMGDVVASTGGNTITRAAISLYRQNGDLRSKRSSETEDEYRAYVKSKNTLVQQTSISEKGKFKFYNLPYKQSFTIVGSKNWRTAYYTIEVTGAEADDGDSVLYYSQKAAYNVKVDSNNTIELDDLLDIGAKRRLITDLSKISENNYKGAESPLSTYLTDVESGKIEQTDAVTEGIRRGIWAERVVNIGANDANDLLKVMVEGVAKLLADAYKDLLDFDSDALTRAKKLKKETEEKMKRVPESVRKAYGITEKDATEYLNKTLGDGARLLTDSEAGSVLDKFYKVLRPGMAFSLRGLGMSETRADNVAEFVVYVLRTLLQTIQHNSLWGGTKMGVPELVKFAVPTAHSLLFDSSYSSCYTSLTKDYLKYSADKMQAWNSADTSVYQTDRKYTVGILNLLIEQWKGVSVSTTWYKAIADTSDSAAAIMGVAGNVVKQAKVAEQFLKINKYIFNGATVIDPAVFTYWTGYNFIGKGVYGAYGEEPSSSDSSTSKAATDSSVVPVHTTSKNERIFKAVASTGSQLKDALNSMTQNLQDNEIGQAMEATGGNSDGNYQDAIAAWKQMVSLFLTQSLGGGDDVVTGTAGTSLINLMREDIESKILEAYMGERLMNIYTDILSGEYEKTSDPLYVAERNKCVSVINSLISKVDELSEEMDSFTNSTKDVEFLPAVVTKATWSSSDEGNEGIITKSPQEFTLHVQVRNISTISVSGLSVELTVTSPNDSVKVSSDTKLTVGNGTLAAADAVDGSGDDEAYVEWTMKYEGDLSQESILLEVDILENDVTPSSFVTANAQEMLLVDPSEYDTDMDFMPDEWEASYGLDSGKDDSQEDLDGDVLTNEREYDLGTEPNVADTDGDGLSDGEEVNGTKTGYDTDPLKEDTDDDGASDGSDGQPLDDSTTEKDESAGEPEVAVDKVAVTLTESEPTASVSVTNIGTSTLYWSAQSENDAIAVTNPSQKNTKMGSLLTISAPSEYDFQHTGTNTTTVTVFDVWGAVKDYKKISVTVQPGAGYTEESTVLPVITDFKPRRGKPGTIVRIMGENFSPKKSENIVAFAGTAAKVVTANKKGTKLKVQVPKEAQTGYITVTVDGNTGESEEQFTVRTSK